MSSSFRFIFIALLGASVFAAAACSSPAETFKKCKASRCEALSSGFAKRICNDMCEKRAYGDFDDEKLAKLCKGGDDQACLRGANLAFKNKDAAALVSNLDIGCGRGCAECCGMLGKAYRRGVVVKRDKPKGYVLMEKGCTLGNVSACASPALNYLLTKKYDKAKVLFTKGCDGGAKMSCGMLGVMYRDGKGVPLDLAKAKALLRKSCKLGNKTACKAALRI